MEKTLVKSGETKTVYDMRASFQDAMAGEFRRVVEDATGRKVIAYMSTVHVDPDLAVEVFLLEPADEAPAPGSPLSRVTGSPAGRGTHNP